MRDLYIGIDLGGTNIAAGVTDREGNILCKKSIPTALPKPQEQVEKDIFSLCGTFCRENGYDLNRDIKSVGIGTPGSVDGARGIVWSNVNFGYENWHLKEDLEKYFSVPVYIENDANAAVIAEAVAGNAKGCSDAVMITLGTGIGGGAYIDGKIYPGYNYTGLEIGHMVIAEGGRKCPCGRRGCFERYASASALTRDTKSAMRKHPESSMWELCPDIKEVNAKTAFDAMKAGDATAKKVIDNYIKYLACGLVNIIDIFQPQVICIGGGVSNQGDFLLDLLKPYVDSEDFARNRQERVKVVTAKFKNDAGIIGAALLGVNNEG